MKEFFERDIDVLPKATKEFFEYSCDSICKSMKEVEKIQRAGLASRHAALLALCFIKGGSSFDSLLQIFPIYQVSYEISVTYRAATIRLLIETDDYNKYPLKVKGSTNRIKEDVTGHAYGSDVLDCAASNLIDNLCNHIRSEDAFFIEREGVEQPIVFKSKPDCDEFCFSINK